MTSEIRTITTPFVFNVSTNCYLVRTGDANVLIDTGRSNKRSAIERELDSAGCRPGSIALIVLTHGDFDHSGNAAYFRKKFGARIAMQNDDAGMVERGDMFWNRKKPNILIRLVAAVLFRLSKSDRFKPDLYLDDGYDLSGFGVDARVLHIPGHSRGSIGILTNDGDLFCGDLLGNLDEPKLWSLIDDSAAANASVERLRELAPKMVYPGHGKPFPMELFVRRNG